MRILAIDFGEKRIGLALSDPLGITAQALPSLHRQSNDADFAHLRDLCAQRGIGRVVVGLPLRLTGEIGHKAKEVIEWAGKLEKAVSCPVETWDERLTSKEAERVMIQQGLSRKRRKEKSDELAAILILQNYLDSHRVRGEPE